MPVEDHIHQIISAEACRLDAHFMKHRGGRQEIGKGLGHGDIVPGEQGLVVENAAYPGIGRVGIGASLMGVQCCEPLRQSLDNFQVDEIGQVTVLRH